MPTTGLGDNMNEFDYNFTLTFSRPLSQKEMKFVEQVVGYASVSHLRIPTGEGPSFEWKGTSVKVYLDTTKTYSDDISFHFPEFWNKLGGYLFNGSKPYEKAFRGKPAGFQLIPSIGFDAEIVSVLTDQETVPGQEQKVLNIEIPEGTKSVTITFNF